MRWVRWVIRVLSWGGTSRIWEKANVSATGCRAQKLPDLAALQVSTGSSPAAGIGWPCSVALVALVAWYSTGSGSNQ
jgi:hypothetical protein